MVSRLDRRGQSSWSVVLLGRLEQSSSWSVARRGQSAFFLVVAVSLRGLTFFVFSRLGRRGESFFVDGVYILFWLCTRIY